MGWGLAQTPALGGLRSPEETRGTCRARSVETLAVRACGRSQTLKSERLRQPVVLEYLSKVWLDIATVVHYYEAILATLAIVIWHFYGVIFDPDVYPLKWTFVSGRAPEHEVREEEEEAAPQAAPESKPGSGSRRGGM